jgi:hypothetical protein
MERAFGNPEGVEHNSTIFNSFRVAGYTGTKNPAFYAGLFKLNPFRILNTVVETILQQRATPHPRVLSCS